MKKLILLMPFFATLFLSSCDSKQGQLVGKWQRTGNPDVIIEFKNNGIYELSVKNEKLPTLRYTYLPDSKENNLEIGEDLETFIGNVEFINEDKIVIKSTKPDTAIEYTRTR